MQRAVHVGVGKVSKPLWVFLLDLFWGETTELVLRGSGGFEETVVLPLSLVFLLQGFQVISLSCLDADECPIQQIERETCLGEFYGISHAE